MYWGVLCTFIIKIEVYNTGPLYHVNIQNCCISIQLAIYYTGSSPKEMQGFESCISFGVDCMPVDLGSCIISTRLLVTNCRKPHVKVSVPGAPGKMDILKLCFLLQRV